MPGALSLVCPMAGVRSNSTKYYMPYVMQYFGTRDKLRVAQLLALNALGFAGLCHNFNLALNVVFGC